MLSLQLTTLALVAAVTAVDVTVNPSLNAQLFAATQQIDRLALLPNDNQWTFDFTTSPKYTFAPGGVVDANAATFPAAVDNELTMSFINLAPCALLPPHLHPRASNYVVGISGNVTTYMIEENGARLVTAELSPGKMTIFPRGSLHTMVNTGCTNAQLISALSNTDQGTSNIVNGLSMFPQEILEASFGGKNQVPSFAKMPAVGTGAIAGTAECLAACGLSH